MIKDQTGNDTSNPGSPFGGQAARTAIILAGGFGTRLRDAIPDLPKCMAPVNGRPFLFYVVNYLRSQGIEKFIFSLGYKHEIVEEYLQTDFASLDFQCLIEKEPLGTGGAILASCYRTSEQTVLVVNGDTLFKIDLEKAFADHLKHDSHCTLLLRPMETFDRYGVVQLNEDDSIRSFEEKRFYKSGLINGGAYILNTEQFLTEELPAKFSFEKDYLEKYFETRRIYGSVQDEYFIDIGIPDDYFRVQQELKQAPLDLKNIDQDWTLFLDRDGVINYEKKDDYIRNWQEFKFYEGVKEALKIFAKKFGVIIVVSNQRGIGKGLMTEDDLAHIHGNMQREIEDAGGRIDAIYYCTAVDAKAIYRKPNPGMAFSAKKDFPEIDLSKSIVAGNKPSDMLFGKNAGMYSVYIASTHPGTPFPHPDIDLRFNSLSDFAEACLPADIL
jgi:D-glycero-alpha-D-manno-heptose 1-phosphate guanylyltransferase